VDCNAIATVCGHRTEDEFLKMAKRKFGWVVGVGCVGG